MSIKIPRSDLERELDRALRDTRTSKGSKLWRDRVEWLDKFQESSAGKTYIAALGGALLAKASHANVDALSNKAGSGPRSYSLRPVAEFLQARVRGRVHLGTLSKNPVNNSPFYKGHERIDRFSGIGGSTRPLYEEFVSWLHELDAYTQAEAHEALVAFLGVRAKAQEDADAASAGSPRMGSARSLDDLLDVLHTFVTEDPEGGGRGQAIVGAVLDCAYSDVEVVPKNHPAPFDVKRKGTPPPLVAEVKQISVKEMEILELARRAADAGADRAIYAALDPAQPTMPVDRLRADALRDHGVMLDVVADVRELAANVAVYAGQPAKTIAAALPQAALERCREHAGVSKAGQERLAALLRGVTAA